jgi:hypothetical protein
MSNMVGKGVQDRQYAIMENIAAIAMQIGLSGKRQAAYDAAADGMGGFSGFYQGAIELGTALEKYVDVNKVVWGENADWILTVENLTGTLLFFMIESRRLPLADEQIELVRTSIMK